MGDKLPKPMQLASSPCMADELQQVYDGSFEAVDSQQSLDVTRWRKSERERLIALRQAMPVATRQALDTRLVDQLAGLLAERGQIVSLYWPFRGEPDLRGLARSLTEAGVTCALPVVVAKTQPLIFRSYAPGDALEPGVWKIPVPSNAPEVVPDVLLAPVVGFDRQGYRLGYGGGFFDRTMAACSTPPKLVGVGYEIARVQTIFPQPHDRPMDLVVTEAGIFDPGA